MRITPPVQDPDSGERTLVFSRALKDAEGSFDGVVAIEVGTAFFVSGYEPSKLGDAGLLGMIGTDGIVKAWRSGSSLSVGNPLDYSSLVTDAGSTDTSVSLTRLPLDDITRYISARKLFGFPLAVVVGAIQG